MYTGKQKEVDALAKRLAEQFVSQIEKVGFPLFTKEGAGYSMSVEFSLVEAAFIEKIMGVFSLQLCFALQKELGLRMRADAEKVSQEADTKEVKVDG